MATSSQRPRSASEYTVACICPMGVELAPVEGMLDEIHDSLPTVRDQNAYTLGEIAGHKIVIAVMPEIGNNAASSTATQLLNDFPSIRFGMLVGVGGGVPGETDVRLGDVVVSRPTKTFGGVVQFDLGKRLANGTFERTGQLDRPPPVLSASVQKLEAQHRRLGSKISDFVSEMLQRYPPMQEEYEYPDGCLDRLFTSTYLHPSSSNASCSSCDASQVTPRPSRKDRKPRIHYGTIGSADVVVKDAVMRDALARQYGILCVEMEAAGFMQAFPCIVVRGICDYADSHKNKRWQPYAAAVAAAYMKELLRVIPPQAVEGTGFALDTVRQRDEDVTACFAHHQISAPVTDSFVNKDKNLEEMINWIAPPPWAEAFEQASAKRADGTLSWILDDPTLQTWQQQVRSSTSTPFDRVLSFQAKPGFGKTVLAATIIEYLANHTQSSSDSTAGQTSSVFYYFFDKLRSSSNSIMDAMRAIIAQLIHRHKDVLMLWEKAFDIKKESQHGQLKATGEDIRELLSELFVHFGPKFVILDGLDECIDCAEFFTIHSDVLAPRFSGILLISRPSIDIPIGFEDSFQVVKLNSLNNSRDIEQFLQREFQKLARSNLLSSDLDVDHATSVVSTRASGMFLWAKLLIEYVHFPIWTLRQRADIILNLNRLEGLDALYIAILGSLLSLNPRQSHITLTRLFQLVLGARIPLSTKELRTAVCVPLDRPHSPLDEISGFGSIISKLSGSLIEVTQQGTVQFVHLSLHDLLTGAVNAPDSVEVPEHIIATYCRNMECTLTSICLSYLRYTLSARPLAGSSQITASILSVEREYPFLRYAATSWSDHFVAGLRECKMPLTSSTLRSWKLVIGLLRGFLRDRVNVTAWIEAAWLFKVPKIKTLPFHEYREIDRSLISAIPYLERIMWKLDRLSDELVDLDRSWSHVLDHEPNEIWEPSITTFKKSDFWVNTSQAKLVRLAPLTDGGDNSITLCSQIADSGTELGVVRLFPPEEWFSCTQLDGIARYELWQIPTFDKICSVEIHLPSVKVPSLLASTLTKETLRTRDEDEVAELRMLRRQAHLSGHEDRTFTISVPVAISRDVRRAVIMDNVIQIDLPQREAVSASRGLKPLLRSQTLDLTEKTNFVPLRNDIDSTEWKYSEIAYFKFSSSTKYLALARESTKSAEKNQFSYGQLWWLQIFADLNFNTSSHPRYVTVCCTTFFAVPEISILSPSRGLAFHPTLPRLAFPQVLDGLPQTYIWDFEDPTTTSQDYSLNPFPISYPPILDPSFTEDGTYLSGTDAPLKLGESNVIDEGFCNPIIVAVPAKLTRMEALLSRSNPSQAFIPQRRRWEVQSEPDEETSFALRPTTSTLDLARSQKTPVHRADCISFDTEHGGVARISQLHALTNKGAVVLRTLGQDQSSKEFTITRLPEEVRKCVDVSLLNRPVHKVRDRDSGSDDTDPSQQKVYLVLNKAHKRYYTRKDTEETMLPALVERSLESISTVVNTIPIEWPHAIGGETHDGDSNTSSRKSFDSTALQSLRIG